MPSRSASAIAAAQATRENAAASRRARASTRFGREARASSPTGEPIRTTASCPLLGGGTRISLSRAEAARRAYRARAAGPLRRESTTTALTPAAERRASRGAVAGIAPGPISTAQSFAGSARGLRAACPAGARTTTARTATSTSGGVRRCPGAAPGMAALSAGAGSFFSPGRGRRETAVTLVFMLVDAVVVAYNSRDHLRACVEPLSRIEGVKVFVADNASTDDWVAAIEDLPVEILRLGDERRLRRRLQRRLSEGVRPSALPQPRRDDRRGVDPASWRRSSTTKPSGWRRRGSSRPTARSPSRSGASHGCARPTPARSSSTGSSRGPPGPTSSSAIRPPTTRQARPSGCPARACSSAGRVFEEVGGFDERFFLYCEDKDLCRRIRAAGYDVRYEPRATARHRGGASAPRAGLLPVLARSRVAYARKHSGRGCRGSRAGRRRAQRADPRCRLSPRRRRQDASGHWQRDAAALGRGDPARGRLAFSAAPMRIWIDVENPPQVQYLTPARRRLPGCRRRGRRHRPGLRRDVRAARGPGSRSAGRLELRRPEVAEGARPGRPDAGAARPPPARRGGPTLLSAPAGRRRSPPGSSAGRHSC